MIPNHTHNWLGLFTADDTGKPTLQVHKKRLSSSLSFFCSASYRSGFLDSTSIPPRTMYLSSTLLLALAATLCPFVLASPVGTDVQLLKRDGRAWETRDVILARIAAERAEWDSELARRGANSSTPELCCEPPPTFRECCVSSCGACIAGSRCSVRPKILL